MATKIKASNLGSSATTAITNIVTENSVDSALVNGLIDSSFAHSKTSDDLSEGSTHLYYTTSRGDSDTGDYIAGNRTYGNITTTGYIAGPATFTIDPAAVGDNTGTLVVAGNLQVDGTTTTINSTTMEVDDLNITLASGAANAAAANGAGITVDGASATITYGSTSDSWSFNKNVGIGATSPSPTFRTSIYGDGSSIIGGVEFRNAAAGGSTFTIGHATATSPSAILNVVDAANLIFKTSNIERMRIDAGGNVGIGTSSPAQPLEIVSSTFAYARKRSTNGSYIGFDVGQHQSGQAVLNLRDNNFMQFLTNDIERLRIDSSGNLLVGTTNTDPAFNNVTGQSMASTGQLQVTRDGGTAALFNRKTSDGEIVSFRKDGGTVGVIGSASSGGVFDISGAANDVRITGGNASYWLDNSAVYAGNNASRDLGTSSFAWKDLYLSGTANVGNLQTTSIGRIFSGNGGNASNPMIANVSDQNTGIYFPAADNMALSTGGSERMRITSAGNVGIGTSSPQKPLDVVSSAYDFVSVGSRGLGVSEWTGIHFGYRENNTSYRKSAIVFERTDLTAADAQGKIHILNGPQGSGGSATLSDAKITIAENGNVGIGTTSPDTDILKFGGSAKGLSVAAGQPAITVRSTANAQYVGYFGQASTNTYLGAIGGGSLIIQTGTSGTESMRIDSSGNVGIGTSNPTVPLDVKKAGGSNWVAQFQNDSIATSYGVSITEPSGAAAGYPLFRVGQGFSPYSDWFRVDTSGNTAFGATPSSVARVRIEPTSEYQAGLRIKRTFYNWFEWGGNPSGVYLHIKTGLYAGGGATGNIAYTMSLFEIKGYTYNAETIDTMIGFHNWSGGYSQLRIQDKGTRAAGSNPYTSSDGYVVLVINTGTNYPGITINWHQAYPYSFRNVGVTSYASSSSSGGVY